MVLSLGTAVRRSGLTREMERSAAVGDGEGAAGQRHQRWWVAARSASVRNLSGTSGVISK